MYLNNSEAVSLLGPSFVCPMLPIYPFPVEAVVAAQGNGVPVICGGFRDQMYVVHIIYIYICTCHTFEQWNAQLLLTCHYTTGVLHLKGHIKIIVDWCVHCI